MECGQLVILGVGQCDASDSDLVDLAESSDAHAQPYNGAGLCNYLGSWSFLAHLGQWGNVRRHFMKVTPESRGTHHDQ